jgi:outer membrane lipoprotein carrier protein
MTDSDAAGRARRSARAADCNRTARAERRALPPVKLILKQALRLRLRLRTPEMRRLVGMIVFILIGVTASAAQTNSLVSTWLNSQTNIRTWSADFVQTRTLKSLTQPLTATGHVWFAAPDRFRWELGRPAQTIAVRARDELRVISPGLKRVERYPLSGNQTGQWRDALALLEAGFPRGEADLTAQFQILSQSVSNRICSLALQPRSAAARRMMPKITLDFGTDDFALRATELQWADGSTMRNDFQNARLNEPMDEALFAPEIDREFKIVEPLKK